MKYNFFLPLFNVSAKFDIRTVSMNKKNEMYIELIVTFIVTLPFSVSFILALFGVISFFQAVLLSLFLIFLLWGIVLFFRYPLIVLLAIFGITL
ncbi:hypothetical protein CRN72_10505 [Pasteurella multocida]|nr:hypothetical protein CO688_10215 [Pasteurella multocida]ATN18143.1 hypothetical protein CRN72_10505 [Pasteurella multocida]